MEEKPKNTKEQANAKNDPKNKKKKDEAEELSEEDKELKEKIDLLCTRIVDPDLGLANIALETLKTEVRTSTTSMTSVPKPFKFLKIHYPALIEHYEKLEQGSAFKKSLSDFLSVLSMTMAESGKQMSLKYLMEGTRSDYRNWGHEYLHHISADIGIEYNKRIEAREPTQDILELVFQIVPSFIDNNSDSDAVDLLLEVDQLETLTQYVTKNNFPRIYLYLVNSSSFSADQDEMLKTLNTTYEICMKLGEYTNALRIALKLDNLDYVKKIFTECRDNTMLKQLCFQLARQRINFMPEDQDLAKIVSNQHLNNFYLQLAKDLEVLDPKSPEQIFKTHLEEKRGKSDIDSAKGNLASTYVNAFVNAGMGKDALMLSKNEKDSPWIYKVKNEGLIAASASLGMIFLFDPAGGANHINDYLELTDGYAKAGAGIAIGLYNTGIIDDCDPAKALLEEQINSKGMNDFGRLGAIIGLGLAYAGSAREDLLETLLPFVMDVNLTIETSAFSALTLSLIFVGKCHEEIGNAILQTLMERSEVQLNSSLARFFGVALGLLFLGQQDSCSATLEVVKTITHPLAKYVEVCVEGCAYVGSGNVLKVQQMFHHCLEHLEEKDAAHQAAAVLSIALIASSEEIGNEMVVRSMNHILQYCEISIKRAVPLALAMLNLSNPKINIMDLLTKLSHDQDAELSQRAIIALGLIGAGTNNSRLAGLLRQLASFYSRDSFSNHMFLIRIAQGLLHMGKGLLTIQPYYSERFLLSNVGMAGIIILLNSCLDMENLILGKYHYLLYYLGLSMYPRMAFTIDENLENVPISVRVGQAVDIVGQAGQPKRITGFQTHTSPVILSAGERAEIATEEYIPVADLILEGLVIVKKNPDYNPDAEKMVSTKKKSL